MDIIIEVDEPHPPKYDQVENDGSKLKGELIYEDRAGIEYLADSKH